MDDIFTTLQVLLAVFGGITVIGSAISYIYKLFGPVRKTTERLNNHDKMLEMDCRRFEKLEDLSSTNLEMNRLMIQTMLALLNHEINGNDIAKLQARKEELQDYLINN